MAELKKINYYDLRFEAAQCRLKAIIGRKEEMERLTRVTNRRINNNAIIVGAAGVGKTALLHGWVNNLVKDEAYSQHAFIQFEAEHIHDTAEADELLGRYQEALQTLPECTLIIDGFGAAVNGSNLRAQQMSRLYASLLRNPEMRLILTMQPNEFKWLELEHPALLHSFEVIQLKSQPVAEQVKILESALPRLNHTTTVVPTNTLKEVISSIERFPTLGQLPRAGISLLDECLAQAGLLRQQALTEEVIHAVVASKTGVPIQKLQQNDIELLKTIEADLNSRIINQGQAIRKITTTIQRAKLGMRNPNKPLGSFLILGPSGVGKTETAKLIAEKLFGRPESFTRFDMSEFGQEHTVQRLIGAPPGYLGHEAGGALTNALRANPHSLILLDEIEKAHPKVFDIFLQVLDDGRLTSGQNETVDAKHAVIMATSNLAVAEILEGFKAGRDIHHPEFLQNYVMPTLTAMFRLEFLNRFDNILIFNPLRLGDLVTIAQLEIKKIEARVAKHNFKFALDPEVLEKKIKTMCDPRFGARPVKRFIEETCETLTVKALLKTHAK
jgi:ATP-dependent Clp protease ATP-binding subunit ClpC